MPKAKLTLSESFRDRRTPQRTRRVKLDTKPTATTADGLGTTAAIERLKLSESRAHQAYLAALDTDDHDLIARKKKDWLDHIEALRKFEVSNPDIERSKNETLPRDEVVREVSRMVLAFTNSLNALVVGLTPRLAGRTEVEIADELGKAVAQVIDQLRTAPWAEKIGAT